MRIHEHFQSPLIPRKVHGESIPATNHTYPSVKSAILIRPMKNFPYRQTNKITEMFEIHIPIAKEPVP